MRSFTNRVLSLSVVLGGSFAAAVFLTGTARSQGGGVKNLVFLQAASPGVSQSGHLNISGTAMAGKFIGGGISSTCIVSGVNASSANDSAGVCGEATSTTGAVYGVVGKSWSGAGAGVYGENLEIGGNHCIGVLGKSSSVFGKGVYGYLAGATNQGYGVLGVADGHIANGGFFTNTHPNGFCFGVTGVVQSMNGVAVRGVANSLNGATQGGYFHAFSDSGIGALGEASATSGVTTGVQGRSNSTSGRGVAGLSTATSGTPIGVYGETSAPSGTGVFGITTSTTGISNGVYGEVRSPFSVGVRGVSLETGNRAYGGRFHGRSPLGHGIWAENTATSGDAVAAEFRSFSPDGYGIIVDSGGGLGTANAILARSHSRSGIAVRGIATEPTTSNNVGVWAEAHGNQGVGLYADETAVLGAGFIYGIYADKTGTIPGYAIFANGNTGASGVKSFRIDDPRDPENRYLLHYSNESPFPQNAYSGNVTTDASGYAWVELPDYFEEINTNVKYVLTVVDDGDSADFVMAKVSKKVRGNRFQIRTSAGRVEVSWMVQADRNDPYVREQRPADSMAKPDSEKGKYLMPELYGEGKARRLMSRPGK